ncbi:hypothetical protein ACFGVR_09015 [Mucilaginibacter sp. AW1-3]
MGLDIHLATEAPEDILNSPDYYDLYFHKHSLSRTFCWFMSRRDVIESGEPELDQIGKLTKVDVLPLYDMNDYPEPEGMEFFLSVARNDDERKAVLDRAEANRVKLEGNIDKIDVLINTFINRLGGINDLPRQLAATEHDTLNNEVYFSDFTEDKGDGFIGNNFGQDLRNFRNYLEYAKSKGKTTVYFRYG